MTGGPRQPESIVPWPLLAGSLLLLLFGLTGCASEYPSAPGPEADAYAPRLIRKVDHEAQVACFYVSHVGRVDLTCFPCADLAPGACDEPAVAP